jgi:hypothetical protein
LDNSSFKEVISKAWANQHITGWMAFILKERLKGLKEVIKKWSLEVYGEKDLKIKKLMKDIEQLDLKSEVEELSELDVRNRKNWFVELWRLLKSKDALIFQQSKAKWLKHGDANTRYFHACVKRRGKRNAIKALRTEEGWVEGVQLIKSETVRYFSNLFSSSEWSRPRLDGIAFPHLTAEQNSLLIAPFTMDEIERVVKESDGSKSPGPDGFNYAFIKEFWGLMKGEVRIMFDQFHGVECLPRGLLSYFLALIPKVNSPETLGDFRPISLLGCLYKLIAKVLAARLALVVGSVVSSAQSAFIKNRQLVDGVLVLNEVVDYAKKTGKDCLILKVDFQKAYDSVDWGFLLYMLHRFGFSDKWIRWIKCCVCSGNMSVVVNGSPTEEINIRKGLKQGDPLAPFLFLLVAEGLGAIMRQAVELNRFVPFKVGRGELPISHLQYADDTVFIGKALVENLWVMKAALRGFELVSGLKVNFWKSCLVGVNVDPDFLGMASRFLNCRIGRIPFIYLGLPVGANPRSLATWQPMIDVLKNRLNSWGNKYVSFGGRIVLLNSVLSAIPIFYLSFLKMPVKVWKEVVKIQRKFLWGGIRNGSKICWVKWEVVTKPKSEGGLGVRDLRRVNTSLLTKWRWRLLFNEGEIWKSTLAAKYGNTIVGARLDDDGGRSREASSWWKTISKIDGHTSWFNDHLKNKVGNGAKTLFWRDIWVGDRPLKEVFPRLFSVSTSKDLLVSEAGAWAGGQWRWEVAWRRNLFDWELDLYHNMLEAIGGISISEAEDRWIWSENEDGFFFCEVLL